MINLIIMMFIFTLISTLIVEIHCRIQIKIIAKTKNTFSLVMHYFLTIPLALFAVFFMQKLWDTTYVLEFSELKKAIVELGCVIIFILPSIYIVSVRYSGLVDKMERWRKN